MFKPISQDQFTMAQDTLEKIRGLLDTRSHLIKQGSLQAELVLPNIIWKRITLFSYFLNPTYDIINTLRLHTFIFTGHYLGYAIVDDHNTLPDSLLKKYRKLTEGLPSEMIARPPRMLGEVGWEVNGGVINKDILMYQRHITSLYCCGLLDYLRSKDSIRILEIGAGYGGLAYFLWKILKPAAFYIVDLPESLAFSSVYLTLTVGLEGASCVVYEANKPETLIAPQDGFAFLPNFSIDDLRGTDKFDLVINTGSFGEMTEEQVGQYADIINELLSEGGVIFEDNGDLVPVSSILAKHFKGTTFYKNKHLWTKNEKVLARLTAKPKPQIGSPNTPRQWFINTMVRLKHIFKEK